MPAHIQLVYTTLPSEEAADRLALALIDERLAACAHRFALHSVYRWRGAVQEDEEWGVLLKTTAERYPALAARLLALHPYEVPALVALPVVAGAPEYLAWIAAAASPPG